MLALIYDFTSTYLFIYLFTSRIIGYIEKFFFYRLHWETVKYLYFLFINTKYAFITLLSIRQVSYCIQLQSLMIFLTVFRLSLIKSENKLYMVNVCLRIYFSTHCFCMVLSCTLYILSWLYLLFEFEISTESNQKYMRLPRIFADTEAWMLFSSPSSLLSFVYTNKRSQLVCFYLYPAILTLLANR